MSPKMYNADSDILDFLDRGKREESGNDNKEARLYGSVVSPVERRVAELYIVDSFLHHLGFFSQNCDGEIKNLQSLLF